MEDVLRGWIEIGKYLEIHPDTAKRYEHSRGLPVQRTPGGGPKAPVFARKSDLDDWLMGATGAKARRAREVSSAENSDLAAPVLNRIIAIGRDTKLYRRNYFLRCGLSRSPRGIQARFEYRFELCNATDERQPFIQEMTVDDSDRGYVENMSFSINGRVAYQLTRPRPTGTHIGYVDYAGPQQSIAPKRKRVTYLCRASWVIHRSENDIWYNHMALPTVGIKIETNAPAGFEITRAFTNSGLMMTGDHLDIAWRRQL